MYIFTYNMLTKFPISSNYLFCRWIIIWNSENKCDVISDDDLMFDGLMRFNLKIGWSVIDMFIIMFYGCVPHFPSVPQKFICRLYTLWRSNYLQKVAIIVDCSNYGISQIQNTCLNMKCSVWRVVVCSVFCLWYL